MSDLATTTNVSMTLQPHGLAQKRLGRIFGYIVLITVTILITLPIIGLVLGSSKQDTELMAYPFQIFPAIPQWFNYIAAFTMTPLFKVMLRNFYWQ